MAKKFFLQTTKARYDICFVIENPRNNNEYLVSYTKIGKHGPEHKEDRVLKDTVTKMIELT